jgi:hypothetical protein
LSPIAHRLGIDLHRQIHTADTPPALLLFQAFSLLPPVSAYWAWFAFNTSAFVVAIYLMLFARNCTIEKRIAWMLAALLLIHPAFVDQLVLAQRQSLILLLLVLTMRWLEQERDGAAGLTLALAAALRAFPLLIAGYLIVRRRWRALGFTVLGLVLIGSVTAAALGIHQCVSYVQIVHGADAQWVMSQPWNLALHAFIWRMFRDAFGPAPGNTIRELQIVITMGSALAILGATIRATSQAKSGPDMDSRAFSLWVAASVILSPVVWIHYMVLLSIPLVRMVVASIGNRCSRRALWAIAISYVALVISSGSRVTVRDLVGQALYRVDLELGFGSLLIAFVGIYWFATDRPSEVEDGRKPRAVERVSA